MLFATPNCQLPPHAIYDTSLHNKYDTNPHGSTSTLTKCKTNLNKTGVVCYRCCVGRTRSWLLWQCIYGTNLRGRPRPMHGQSGGLHLLSGPHHACNIAVIQLPYYMSHFQWCSPRDSCLASRQSRVRLLKSLASVSNSKCLGVASVSRLASFESFLFFGFIMVLYSI